MATGIPEHFVADICFAGPDRVSVAMVLVQMQNVMDAIFVQDFFV